MKKTLLAILILASVTANAQIKPKADSVLTMQTKFVSIEDVYRKADNLKDSVTARSYELIMFGIEKILKALIEEWHLNNKK